jgi:hypothetical protein
MMQVAHPLTWQFTDLLAAIVLTANIYLIAAPQPNSNQHVWVDMHCHS